MTVRKGIFLAIVLFALIPSSILASVKIYMGKEKTKELYVSRMQSMTNSLASTMDDVLAMCREEVILLSTSWNMREFLNVSYDHNSSGKDIEDASQLLYENFIRYTEKLDFLDDVFLLNADGNVVLSCEPEIMGLDLSDMEYFKVHSQNFRQHDANFVYTCYVHDSLTQTSDMSKRSLPLSRCIVDEDGNLKYIMVLYFNAEKLGRLAASGTYGETGISFVIDESNYILHHPEARFANSFTVASALTDLVPKYQNGEIEQSGYVEDVLDGELRMYYYKVLSEGNVAVVLRQNYDEYLADVNKDIVTSICIIVLMTAVVLIIGFFISGKLSSPIKLLIKAFRKGHETGRNELSGIEFKGELSEIVSGYGEMIRQMEKQQSDIEKEKQRSDYLHTHDSLTGLYNREAFEKEFSKNLRESSSVGLIILDIYGFKKINNTYGHHVGDAVLREVADRLERSEGKFEVVARAGNGQYILAKVGGRAQIDAALLILHDELRKSLDVGHARVQLTVNMGLSVYPDDGLSIDQLMSNADIAMSCARENKLEKHLYFEQSMREKVSRTGLIMEVLRDCVENGEIFLMYQPLYALNDGRVTGFEALMRIRSKQLGLLSPIEFIPLAETVPEMAVKMGNWALKEACRFLRSLVDKKNFDGIISVNLSPLQIFEENFTDNVLAVLSEYNVPGSQLQLEVTEHSINGYVEEFAPKFIELRKHGVLISLDDFGGIRSSFYFLSHLPLDAIKVDQSFFLDIKNEERMSHINKSLLELAKRFDLRVSAERVETQDDSDMLKAIGFDGAQGYCFSPPLTEDKADELLN